MPLDAGCSEKSSETEPSVGNALDRASYSADGQQTSFEILTRETVCKLLRLSKRDTYPIGKRTLAITLDEIEV